jgi:hypothetical protein
VEVIRRNLLLADWCDDTHTEVRDMMGCAALGWAGLGWAGLCCAVLCWAGRVRAHGTPFKTWLLDVVCEL